LDQLVEIDGRFRVKLGSASSSQANTTMKQALDLILRAEASDNFWKFNPGWLERSRALLAEALKLIENASDPIEKENDAQSALSALRGLLQRQEFGTAVVVLRQAIESGRLRRGEGSALRFLSYFAAADPESRPVALDWCSRIWSVLAAANLDVLTSLPKRSDVIELTAASAGRLTDFGPPGSHMQRSPKQRPATGCRKRPGCWGSSSRWMRGRWSP
jgi:hypothetical protein